MAIKKEIWDKAKVLFELGKSLNEIESATGINRTSVGKKAKKEGWEKAKNLQLKHDIAEFEKEKSTLDDKKSTLVEKVAKLSDFEITILDDVVTSEFKMKSLLFSTQTLAVVRSNQALTKGTKQVMLKVAQYAEGQKVSEDYEPFNQDLEPHDIKTIVDGVDKASITLGVNQRHQPKQDISLVNAQQNNTNEIVGYEVIQLDD